MKGQQLASGCRPLKVQVLLLLLSIQAQVLGTEEKLQEKSNFGSKIVKFVPLAEDWLSR